MTKEIIYKMIEEELQRAEDKFPWWPTDPIHAAAIVAEEAGELVQAALQFTYEERLGIQMHEEAIQVGAMAIRFLMNMTIYKAENDN